MQWDSISVCVLWFVSNHFSSQAASCSLVYLEVLVPVRNFLRSQNYPSSPCFTMMSSNTCKVLLLEWLSLTLTAEHRESLSCHHEIWHWRGAHLLPQWRHSELHDPENGILIKKKLSKKVQVQACFSWAQWNYSNHAFQSVNHKVNSFFLWIVLEGLFTVLNFSVYQETVHSYIK